MIFIQLGVCTFKFPWQSQERNAELSPERGHSCPQQRPNRREGSRDLSRAVLERGRRIGTGLKCPVRVMVQVTPQKSPMFMRFGTLVHVQTPLWTPSPGFLLGLRLGSEFELQHSMGPILVKPHQAPARANKGYHSFRIPKYQYFKGFQEFSGVFRI